ncbi:MAG TPA: TlpA disulfide reductase family protein [Pyrinomonadaceae bacterium]
MYAAQPGFVVEGSVQIPVIRNTQRLVLRTGINVLLGVKYLFEVKDMLRAIVFSAALIAMQGSSLGQSNKAPALALKDLRGRTVRLSNYKGKVVLLNFWATWCPPCRAEMPDLIKMQREYRSKGLQVIGITYPPEEIEEVRQFIRKLGVNYPVALGTKETKTLFDQTETLPLTMIIDRQGNIIDRIEGILLPVEFEQKIKPLLK